MISIDTNILFYSINANAPLHKQATQFLEDLQTHEDVAICELMLAELYRLVRNPTVNKYTLNALQTAALIKKFRQHSLWRLVGFPPESHKLHDKLWDIATQSNFAYRRLYDVRLALVLQQHGVTDFATTNVKDFVDLGFKRVWNPLE